LILRQPTGLARFLRALFSELLRAWVPSRVGDDEFAEYFIGHMRPKPQPRRGLSFVRTMKEAHVAVVLS